MPVPSPAFGWGKTPCLHKIDHLRSSRPQMKSFAERLIDVGAITQADGFSVRRNVPPGSDVSYFKRCAFILKTRIP
jgi:hypothetical protein